MPRPLKRGILGASTIILSKDIDKYTFMCGSNFYESDVTWTDTWIQLLASKWKLDYFFIFFKFEEISLLIHRIALSKSENGMQCFCCGPVLFNSAIKEHRLSNPLCPKNRNLCPKIMRQICILNQRKSDSNTYIINYNNFYEVFNLSNKI